MRVNVLLILFLFLLSSCSPKPANPRYVKKESPKESHRSDIHKEREKKNVETTGKYSAEEIFEKCNPAVFTITSDNWMYQSQGSGFFVNSSGLAISNYHVLDGTDVNTAIVYLSTGEELSISEVVAYDEDVDFIIFRVDLGRKSSPYLKMTDRKSVIGSKVFAIGSPKGLTNTLSSGEISQLRGDYVIQINAPIDHGSSGGALINEYGEVIGITSAGMDDSGANLNFAIDISVVKPYLPDR